MLAKNVPFMQIVAGIGFFSFANILATSGLVYYVKYYLGGTAAIAGPRTSPAVSRPCAIPMVTAWPM
jgi:Na+/melibiose symporter-like transporter